MKNNIGKKKIDNKKIRVSALIAFITCILIAAINAFIGIYYHSIINLAMFIYYVIFVIITGIILSRFYKKAHMDVVNLYFWTNIVLIVLGTSLIVPLSLIIEYQKALNLPIWIFIVYSLYTVYKIVYAIIGYKKHKYNNNLLFTELKTIKLIDACLGILSLVNIGILTFVKDTLPFSVTLPFMICGIVFIVGIVVLTSISFYRGLSLIKQDKHFKHEKDLGC